MSLLGKRAKIALVGLALPALVFADSVCPRIGKQNASIYKEYEHGYGERNSASKIWYHYYKAAGWGYLSYERQHIPTIHQVCYQFRSKDRQNIYNMFVLTSSHKSFVNKYGCLFKFVETIADNGKRTDWYIYIGK